MNVESKRNDLYTSKRKGVSVRGVFCIFGVVALFAGGFGQRTEHEKAICFVLAIAFTFYIVCDLFVRREYVVVEENALHVFRRDIHSLLHKSEIVVPNESVQQIRCVKDTIMFGDKTAAIVIIKRKGEKELVIGPLENGELMTQQIGERLRNKEATEDERKKDNVVLAERKMWSEKILQERK